MNKLQTLRLCAGLALTPTMLLAQTAWPDASAQWVTEHAPGGTTGFVVRSAAASAQVRRAELVSDPERLDFGNIEAPGRRLSAAEAGGFASAARSLQLINRGSAALRLGAPRVVGTQAADFRVESSTCGAELAPGAACEIALRFQPAEGGTSRAQLEVPRTGAPVLLIALKGQGLQGGAAGAALGDVILHLPLAGATVYCARGANTALVSFSWSAPAGAAGRVNYRLMAEPGGELASGTPTLATARLLCADEGLTWWVEAQAGGLESRSVSRPLLVQLAPGRR